MCESCTCMFVVTRVCKNTYTPLCGCSCMCGSVQICVWVFMCHSLHVCACGAQKTIYRNRPSHAIDWVLGLDIGSQPSQTELPRIWLLFKFILFVLSYLWLQIEVSKRCGHQNRPLPGSGIPAQVLRGRRSSAPELLYWSPLYFVSGQHFSWCAGESPHMTPSLSLWLVHDSAFTDN